MSPKPHAIVKLIESAQLPGHSDEAQVHIEQFRIAFSAEYELWLKGGR
ncbi:hypothetical protein [Variovorax paradoxus]